MGFKFPLIIVLSAFHLNLLAQMSAQDLIFEENNLPKNKTEIKNNQESGDKTVSVTDTSPEEKNSASTLSQIESIKGNKDITQSPLFNVRSENTPNNSSGDSGIVTIQYYQTMEAPATPEHNPDSNSTTSNNQRQEHSKRAIENVLQISSTNEEESQESKEFKTLGIQILLNLKAHNISKIGSLDLNKVIELIEKNVTVEFTTDEEAQQEEGAYLQTLFSKWEKDINNKAILYVDSALWSEVNYDRDLQEILALSELLSAVGFNDSNYFLSFNLWLLSKNTEISFISIAEKRFLYSDIEAYLREIYKYNKNINELKKQVQNANESGANNIFKELSPGSYLFGPAVKMNLLRNAIEDFKKDQTPEKKAEIIRLHKIPLNQSSDVKRFMAFYMTKKLNKGSKAFLSEFLATKTHPKTYLTGILNS